MSQTVYEEQAYFEGHRLIAGVDEAGRGPLAGPVVAAACILPRSLHIEGIDDSKKLKAKQREKLYHVLITHPAIVYGIGVIENALIDKINILRASLQAMALAVKKLSKEPDYLLIDGNHLPPTHIASKAVIKGDSHSVSIGAASIIAKHKRDLLMIEYHKKYPNYGFAQHKGYGTKVHVEALKLHGPCPIHRTSFEPVKSLTSPLKLDITSAQQN
ncbi:MAG: ribonuclease HII [Simkaniaceae bacterium]|nr:ribonuclease HII [Simkaniaceae bacterium]